MGNYYQNIYTSLRSALIDRDMGDKEEEAVLVDFVSGQIALKPSIPSAALLISYSMLFYPNWLNTAKPEVGKPATGKTIETFLGGAENPLYPLLFNVHMGMIAVGVGVYAKLWTVQYSHVLGTILLNPNMDSPLVKKTYEMIHANRDLNWTHARDIFIELMQQEEYAQGIFLADDYIANASFIAEAEASVDGDINEYIEKAKAVDLSKEFGGTK